MTDPGSAAEIIGDPDHSGAFVFICEHASQRVPSPLEVAPSDRPWLDMHWGFDIGAQIMTEVLVERLGAVAVLANFSRLVIDPNRGLDEAGLIPQAVEGYPLSFNAELSAAEQARRVKNLHAPYHHTVDALLTHRISRQPNTVLISVHSLTPDYMGSVREMELSVMYDEHERAGESLAAGLAHAGLITAVNKPYSGREGLMYSAHRHSQAHGCVALQIETRQDLIDTNARAQAMALKILSVIEGCCDDLSVKGA